MTWAQGNLIENQPYTAKILTEVLVKHPLVDFLELGQRQFWNGRGLCRLIKMWGNSISISISKDLRSNNKGRLFIVSVTNMGKLITRLMH
jgi:hypothetical protein